MEQRLTETLAYWVTFLNFPLELEYGGRIFKLSAYGKPYETASMANDQSRAPDVAHRRRRCVHANALRLGS